MRNNEEGTKRETPTIRLEMPILLELFSGTGSVGRAFSERGWTVFSVDINPAANPSLVADVMELLPVDLPLHVDCIWASPPCKHYSRARTRAKTPRDLEGSDALVQKVLDIIRYYNYPDYFMENPHSGLMKTRDVVAGLDMRVVDYCKYGKDYRQRTSIWTDTGWHPKRPLCQHDCAGSVGNRHASFAQRGGSSGGPRYTLNELYSIPADLCDEIAQWMWP